MKVVSVALIVCLVGSSFALTEKHIEEWQQFKARHQKSYRNQMEADMRFKIFVDNLVKIYKHNKEYEEGKHTYKMGVNRFTDLLHSEFLDQMTVEFPAFHGEKKQMSQEGIQQLMSVEADETVDWRQKGAVTPVKDQGQCGSCWSFSATGSLEGQYFLKNGELKSFSEQNLVDCTRKYDCYGCSGGWPARAYDYIFDNGGIDTEETYTYEAMDDSCRYDPNNSGTSISGHVMLPEKDEEALKNAVSSVGPISILVNAQDFHSYSSGIYYSDNCNEDALNHAVLAVGYGAENGEEYWLVKNSWSASWGEDGYIRVARNKNNVCGIASSNVYPTM